jgi:NADH-quinone oxidoreductase subunit M
MLTGIYQAGFLWPAIVGLVAIVLASAYFLQLYQGIMNGPRVDDLPERRDLTWLEGLAVAPLLAALVYVGVQPAAILATFAGMPK